MWIPLHWIARGGISRSGWKEEFFCSPFKGLLSSLVWKDTATNRFFHCSRQRKIRFFRSCRGHVPVALLSFASFVFGKGQVWLRVVKSVWNWFFFSFFRNFRVVYVLLIFFFLAVHLLQRWTCARNGFFCGLANPFTGEPFPVGYCYPASVNPFGTWPGRKGWKFGLGDWFDQVINGMRDVILRFVSISFFFLSNFSIVWISLLFCWISLSVTSYFWIIQLF